MKYVVPLAVAVACAALLALLLRARKEERKRHRQQQFDARLLYEQGEHAANASAARGALDRVRVFVGNRRKSKNMSGQLMVFLPQVTANLRSSQTLERAVRSAAQGVEDPLREELLRVLADAAYGMPLSEAFSAMGHRTKNADIRALASALRVQQRFGGGAAPVIDLVANHVRARDRAARELRTELAGTKLAKWFVAGAMPVIFSIMFFSNPSFAQFYRQEPLGWLLLGVAAAFELVGLVVSSRITKLDVRGV